MPSDSYPFAVGRIKGLERGFLTQQDFNRIEEQPLHTAVKQLADSGYGSDAQDKLDPDSLVAAEMKHLHLLIDEVTPDKATTDLFWLDQDAINIKLMLKARLLKEEVSDSDFAYGLFETATLKNAVENRNYSSLPSLLHMGMDGIEQLIRDKQTDAIDPFAISTEVDRVIYGYILSTSKNAFVHKYFKAKLDFTNVVSFLRARALLWEKEKINLVFIEGGDIGLKCLLDAYDLSPDKIERAITCGKDIDGAVRRGLSQYKEDKVSIVDVTEVLDAELAKIASSERLDSFGIGPIVNYLYRRVDEGKKLRILFAKKRIGEMGKKAN